MRLTGIFIARASAVALIGGLGIHAYTGNRQPEMLSGTVDRLTMSQTSEGATLDKSRPVVLTDGTRLNFAQGFEGSVAVGTCYDFTLINKVSAPILDGSRGDIAAATPCAAP